MEKEYTIKSWKPWIDQETDEPVRDNYGNYKGSATFDEYHSEPVDATFKEQPNVGDKKYGKVVEYTTKSNKTRMKFQSVQRPREGFSGNAAAPSNSSKGYQKSPEERDGIFRCNALTNAAVVFAAVANKEGAVPVKNITAVADGFYAWLKQTADWVPSEEDLNAALEDDHQA